jgi:phospholipase C
MSHTDRRTFLQLMGMTAMASTLRTNIARALEIPANTRTGTIRDVEHIIILMQENRPFDHHFGTLRGVRGFSDPRAVKINLPLPFRFSCSRPARPAWRRDLASRRTLARWEAHRMGLM